MNKYQNAIGIIKSCGLNIKHTEEAKRIESTIIDALEKQIPKKPVWDMGWVCPNCKHAEILNFPKRPEWDDLFCKKCGQALDWSDTNDR